MAKIEEILTHPEEIAKRKKAASAGSKRKKDEASTANTNSPINTRVIVSLNFEDTEKGRAAAQLAPAVKTALDNRKTAMVKFRKDVTEKVLLLVRYNTIIEEEYIRAKSLLTDGEWAKVAQNIQTLVREYADEQRKKDVQMADQPQA